MDPENSSNNQKPISVKKPLVPVPVSAGSSGTGLPYAPEDWPCPGDIWHWKVGKRMSAGGYWIDRYLYLPPRLLKEKLPASEQRFKSRHLVEQYIREKFPDVDVEAFFSSFIWKIPCKSQPAKKGGLHYKIHQKDEDITGESEFGNSNDAPEGRSPGPACTTFDACIASTNLEDKVDQVLTELKESQEKEYRIAEEKLYAQKDFLLSLYQQLDIEKAEVANPMSPHNGGDVDLLLTNVSNRVEQIKYQESKLKHMMQISKGFGQTSKPILKEYFGLSLDG